VRDGAAGCAAPRFDPWCTEQSFAAALFAHRSAINHWYSTAYNETSLLSGAEDCQNGIDSKLYAFGRALTVENRTPLLVVWRHPVVDSKHTVIDSKHPVVDSRSQFFKIVAAKGPLETSSRRSEASGRRLEALFRRLKTLGRQSGAVNFEIGSLQSPSGGFQSFAQTVQSIMHLDHSRDRSARLARRTRHRTRRAREPPGRCYWNLGRGFSRPSLEARSIMAAFN
jgi:hypothetical protein